MQLPSHVFCFLLKALVQGMHLRIVAALLHSCSSNTKGTAKQF